MRTVGTALLLACGVCVSAEAAFLQVGGIASPVGWVTTRPLAVEERFDGPGFPSIAAFSMPAITPAGVRTSDTSILGRHLAPRSNSFGYLSVGNAPIISTLNLTINGDFRYIGFDWGSIDEYNIVRFYDSTNQPIFFENFGTQISGLALAEFLEVPLYGSLFIDFSFFRSPIPRRIELISFNNAFEIDNLAFAAASIVPEGAVFTPLLDSLFGDPAWENLPAPVRPEPFGDAPVPAPATLGLLGIGVALVAAQRAQR